MTKRQYETLLSVITDSSDFGTLNTFLTGERKKIIAEVEERLDPERIGTISFNGIAEVHGNKVYELMCDECNAQFALRDNELPNFCPNCGIKLG